MTLKIATIALTDEALARMLPYGVAVAGSSGITVTFPITGTVAMGAGTLTVATANDVTVASHTHAITASSSPGAASAILKTSAGGELTLQELNTNAITLGVNALLWSNINAPSLIDIANIFVGQVANLRIDGTLATNVTGIIDVAAAKTLNVDNTVNISGTDNENLILTKGLTVSRNSGELAFSVTGSIVTIPASLTVAGLGIANVFTANQTVTLSSATALKVNSTAFPNHFIVDTLNGYIGVNGVPTDTQLQIFNYAISTARGLAVDNYVAHSQGAQVQFRHSRGSGTHVALAAEDVLGLFAGYGSDGYGWQIGCSLKFACESIPASGTMAGYMAFFTRAAGGTNTEKARIGSRGNFLLGTTVNATANDGKVLIFGNNVTDPTLGSTGTCAVYGKIDTGVTEVYVMDGNGVATKISPHDQKTGEWIFYSKNIKTGQETRINIEQMVAEVERLSGKQFIYKKYKRRL